jgi:prevent-host-death family protein
MAQYTTSDLSRKSGDIIADAMQAPVTITQRKKPRLVLMSIDEFNRITKKRQDTRKSYLLSEMSEEMLAEAQETLTLLEAEVDRE